MSGTPPPPIHPVSAAAVSPRSRQHSRTARPSELPAPRSVRMDRVRWMAHVRPGHIALALGLLHLGLVLLSMIPRPHDGGDNAAYLALARSLREHGTYRELWDPAGRPHTQYPPGWPLILAGALRVGLAPWVGFKVVAALFSAGAVALSYLWARRVATPGTALGVGVVLAVATGVVDTGRWELSDPSFWAFTMLALYAFARMREDASAEDGAPPSAPAQTPRWKTLAGPLAIASIATLLAYATRSAGLPLLVAAGAWLAWRRGWRAVAVFAATIGPFAVYWWARGRASGAPSYAAHLWYTNPYHPSMGTVKMGGMLRRIGANTVEFT
ncbi:MAG TPA: phospholipid carrier-dependent glycosyltransferase, partial [Longimicrobium sp.]|nr:phospholipid carrier-dependent glycosyltransferase [Longimicrobium sp.]